ncbi:hypothetical protein PVK06_019915 [Gossypium arboreum]|uniref:Pleckstrin-like plant domain-containing protein n=1 Tax=Gossypium arboreum TaxID=29729 RepID=A0ABR0PLE2_GOSAR|nr:hypothetical protein PVK06_019915 [Gossypium arboreum]
MSEWLRRQTRNLLGIACAVPGLISGVHSDIPAWLKRKRGDNAEQSAYFGIKTGERIIGFECKTKGDKQMRNGI